MKKIIFLILGIILVAGSVMFVIRFFSGEDDWICKDGQWQKHGNPSAPKPTNACDK